MLNAADFAAIGLSLQLAACTTLVLLLVCTPLAWWLATTASRFRSLVNALVLLPLVLPPTVLGFYLLLLMGPHGWLGKASTALGLGTLTFSFTGLLLGSVLFSLPFAVQPLQHAFEAVGKRPFEAAQALRASPIDAFFSVVLPLAKPGFFTAAVLCFAHTLGEFGVVLMLGGNIAGKTQVVSTQIYGHVEAMAYAQAHVLSALMLLLSFAVLLLIVRKQARVARVAA